MLLVITTAWNLHNIWGFIAGETEAKYVHGFWSGSTYVSWK
jgi:hypothetical protein